MWLIIRGGKSTSILFIGNRDGIWKQIWGIRGSFMRASSIIDGNGSYIQILDTTISRKGISEAVINRPVVVLSR